MNVTMKTDLTGFAREMAALRRGVNQDVPDVLKLVGQTLVTWLRSTDPNNPTPSPDPDRDPHPGGWHDVTTTLEKGYDFDVIKTFRGWRLRLSNSVEYAAELDVKKGYFVLDGVDVIAKKEVHKLLRIVLPDWDIRIR